MTGLARGPKTWLITITKDGRGMSVTSNIYRNPPNSKIVVELHRSFLDACRRSAIKFRITATKIAAVMI